MKIMNKIRLLLIWLICSIILIPVAFWNWWDLTSPSFMVNSNDLFPWLNAPVSWSSNIANWFLWSIIQNMMVVLGTLSIFIMTIWAWYMILHTWQEEFLTRWKSIFMAWIYAMVIALSAYYLVAILRFILYS